jgi:hypothetical protein
VGLSTIFYCFRFETSLFVASYDSQGYGGVRWSYSTPPSHGIDSSRDSLNSSRYMASGRIHRKHLFHRYPYNASITACLFFAAGTRLPRHCLAMNVYSDFTITDFRLYVKKKYIYIYKHSTRYRVFAQLAK